MTNNIFDVILQVESEMNNVYSICNIISYLKKVEKLVFNKSLIK